MHGHDDDEPLVRRMRETARAGDIERQRAIDAKLDDIAKRAMEPRAKPAEERALLLNPAALEERILKLESTAAALAGAPVEHIMQFFAFAHLPPHLQEVSRPFGEMAARIVATLPDNRERLKALDKLLEAKDAAVRSLVAK